MQRYCIAIVIVALGLREVICRAFTSEEGAYEVQVYNVSKCVVERPWFHVNVSVYISHGRRLLRGSLVTTRPMKNIKFSTQMHYIDQGKVKVFELKNQNCRSLFVQSTLTALGVRYDTQKCTMEPTTTEFSDLDINAISHGMVQSMWYGTAVTRWEVAIPTVTLMCLDVNMQIIKSKPNGVKTP